jgi:hypothetical protein
MARPSTERYYEGRAERAEREMERTRSRVMMRQQGAARVVQRFSRGFLVRLVTLRDTGSLESMRRTPSELRAVMRHLVLAPADVVATSGLGQSPPAAGEGLPRDLHLYRAAREGNFEAVARLVTSGADLHHCDPWDHFTPLLIAAYCGHATVVALLLSRGASAMARDRGGLTALHWAAGFGHADVCEVLRTRGRASPHARDGSGETAIGRAERNNHTSLAAKLREEGEDSIESSRMLSALAQASAVMNARSKLARAVRRSKDERRGSLERGLAEGELEGDILLERRRSMRQSLGERSRSRHASKEL